MHELILRLPDGYQTDVGQHGSRISLGQRQRLGLARALFGDPALVVLDEPNSNLDSEGNQALMTALAHLKPHGRTALIVTHQALTLQTVDKCLVLKDGCIATFGDRDQVLKVIGQGGPQRVAVSGAPNPYAGGARPALVPAAP